MGWSLEGRGKLPCEGFPTARTAPKASGVLGPFDGVELGASYNEWKILMSAFVFF